MNDYLNSQLSTCFIYISYQLFRLGLFTSYKLLRVSMGELHHFVWDTVYCCKNDSCKSGILEEKLFCQIYIK